MDPTQTPRAVVESNVPRPLLMVKQNRTQPPGFHTRPLGLSPVAPRYPIHNGAAGGPRLGGWPPPELQRLDSRSTLTTAAGQPNQFVQQRPPFVPPRSQITPATSPGIFPRAQLPPTNPSNQPPLRYPNSSPSPILRGPPYPILGQRPPFTPNSQQFLRPQRPPTFETSGGQPPNTRFSTYSSSNDNRQVTPRMIPGNIGTGPQNNDSTLRIQKTIAAFDDNKTQRTLPIGPGSLEKMENNEPQSTSNVVDEEHERIDRNETPKRKPTAQNRDGDDDKDTENDNDNDDDDVIVDMERDGVLSPVDVQTVTPNISNSSKSSSQLSHIDNDSIRGEQSNSRTNMKNLPVTNNEIISRELLPRTQTCNESNSTDSITPMTVEENKLIVDTINVVDNVTKPFRNSATKTPSPKFTRRSPDVLATSPLSTSLTPSPDPTTAVMGYDNGKLRSLSPKSTNSLSPVPSPLTPTSPKIPSTPMKPMDKEKITNILENSSHTDNTERVVTESTVTKIAVPEKFSPLRIPSPGNSSTKISTFRHSVKSGDGEHNERNSTIQPTPLATNGVAVSPTKKLPTKLRENDKLKPAGSPIKSPTKSIKSLPRTPESAPPATVEKKKVPMNKVQVGAAPSPNLKTVRSKIGSLDNTSYKPGGGKVKIENRKLDFSKAQPKIAAKNDKYAPSGGDKKITQVKLQWNAKPKVGSLDNATYKPGGGDKKIETVKLDFKDKAKPKVGSKDNAKHIPGGGTVKLIVTPPKTPQELMNDIETQKIDIKAESKVGSMDNMKHKPGGGDKKIFNDRDYLRQTSSNVESVNGSGAQDNVNEFNELKKPNPNPPPSTPTRTRTPTSLHLQSSVTAPITARAIRTSLQAKSPDVPKKLTITSERIPQDSNANVSLNTNPEDSIQTAKSPSSKTIIVSRPPSSISLKSQGKSASSYLSRTTSPKGFYLPKLRDIMSSNNLGSQRHNQELTMIKLPKLIKTSTSSSNIALAQ